MLVLPLSYLRKGGNDNQFVVLLYSKLLIDLIRIFPHLPVSEIHIGVNILGLQMVILSPLFFSLKKERKKIVKPVFNHFFVVYWINKCTTTGYSFPSHLLSKKKEEKKETVKPVFNQFFVVYWINKCTTTGYSFPLFSSLLVKWKEKEKNE